MVPIELMLLLLLLLMMDIVFAFCGCAVGFLLERSVQPSLWSLPSLISKDLRPLARP